MPNSSRCSSLRLISEHQQPRSVAPQLKSLPQAAHCEAARQRGEIIAPSRFRLLAIAFSEPCAVGVWRPFQPQSRNASIVGFQNLNFEATKSQLLTRTRHFA